MRVARARGESAKEARGEKVQRKLPAAQIRCFHFDDAWAECPQQRRICPSEMSHHAVDDMGLGLGALLDSADILTEFF